jgi:hypothetical protein
MYPKLEDGVRRGKDLAGFFAQTRLGPTLADQLIQR